MPRFLAASFDGMLPTDTPNLHVRSRRVVLAGEPVAAVVELALLDGPVQAVVDVHAFDAEVGGDVLDVGDRLVVPAPLDLHFHGAGGVVVPPEGYWRAIAPILKAHDILLIFDEGITGFGRTGTMFGMEQYGVTPDIVSFAKGITSGYVPLGGVGVGDDIFETLSEPDRMFMHGFTYSGHPVACAVALPNIRIIEEERLPENAGRAGAYLLAELSKLLERPYVGNVRGKGLMLYVEVVADKATEAKFDPALNVGGRLTAATRERGIIVRPTNDGIAIAPILTIQPPELDAIAGAIADALDEVLG